MIRQSEPNLIATAQATLAVATRKQEQISADYRQRKEFEFGFLRGVVK